MAAKQVRIIASLTPPKESVDKFAEILANFCAWVKENEPATMAYELMREINNKNGVVSLVVIECYQDQAALKAHMSSKEFKAMSAELAKHGMKDAKAELKFVEPAGGFASRL